MKCMPQVYGQLMHVGIGLTVDYDIVSMSACSLQFISQGCSLVLEDFSENLLIYTDIFRST